MGEKKVNLIWNHNVTAFENGWGKVALPIVAGEKRPVWQGWQNASLTYDPSTPGYEPEAFDALGCGVGLRAGIDIGDGTVVLGLDIDVKDWRLVAEIMALVREFLGSGIVTREGNAPKILVPVRVKLEDALDWKPRPIQVGEEGKGYKVEMIYKGKQFVVRGIHPDTGKEYRCSEDVLARGPSSLAVVPMEVLKRLFENIQNKYARQVSDTDTVSGAVADSNTAVASPSVSRVDVSKLIAACMRGEDIHENLNSAIAAKVNEGMDAEMVRDWLAGEGIPSGLPREQDRLGDAADERSEIGRMISGAVLKWGKGSKWEFLHDGLRGVVGGGQSAQGDFGGSLDVVGILSEDDPFAPVSETQKLVEKLAGALMKPRPKFKLVSTGWDDDPKTRPLTPFLDEGQMLLRGAVMAVQGKPMTGKSTWALNYLLHLMTGVGGKEYGAVLRGYKTDAERTEAGKKLKVLFLSADDPSEMVKKRVDAWKLHWKVPKPGLEGRLFTLSVTEGIMGLRLDTPEGKEALCEMVRDNGIDIVMADPASNLMPQSDGGNDEALEAIKGVIGVVAALGVAALFVFHTRKSEGAEGAESTLEDIRGAGAIGGAVRGSKGLRFPNEKECKEFGLDPRGDGRVYRKLSHTKNSYGRLADDVWYKVVGVELLNDGTGLGGDSAAVLERVDVPGSGRALTDADIQEFLKDLWTAAGARKHYTDNARAGSARDVFKMAREVYGWGVGRTREVITLLQQAGNISIDEDVQLKGRSSTNLTRGIRVENENWQGTSHTANELSPFDPMDVAE